MNLWRTPETPIFMIGCHEHLTVMPSAPPWPWGSPGRYGKTVRMVCRRVSLQFTTFWRGAIRWLPRWNRVLSRKVVIALDCADRSRLSLPEWPEQAVFINIDHHISNTGFGHLSYVLPDAAATGEIIADFLFAHGMPINSAVAVALYTAVATDTDFPLYQHHRQNPAIGRQTGGGVRCAHGLCGGKGS